MGTGASTWVVPGAPLAEGKGWRVWYSRSGDDPMPEPAPVSVSLAGRPQDVSQEWRPLPPIPNVARQAGVLTVTLDTPVPGARYDMAIPEAERSRPFAWRTLPDSIDRVLPDRPGMAGTSFIFSSCFWWNNDKEGAYAAGMFELAKVWQPAFKLLLGDQVYQDWPLSLESLDNSYKGYDNRYVRYWGDDKYRELLQCMPNFFMGDDHEFWNDYPERQLHIAQTWTSAGRATFGKAAHATYDFYQRSTTGNDEPWIEFDVAPVSFFVSDTRSQRSSIGDDDPHFLSDEQWDALERWAHRLKGPGVLTLGQPLYHHFGSRKDHTLPDFTADFARLARLFERSLGGANEEKRPHDILVLSGDIHIGRYTVGRLGNTAPFNEVHEFIASAGSRIAPDLKTPHPEAPPTKMTTEQNGRVLQWDVQMSEGRGVPALDNNLALVHMSRGTAAPDGSPRVRFRMELWRVRPYDTRHLMGRLFRRPKPKGPLARLFSVERELR